METIEAPSKQAGGARPSDREKASLAVLALVGILLLAGTAAIIATRAPPAQGGSPIPATSIPALGGETENDRCNRTLSELPILLTRNPEAPGGPPPGSRIRYLKALACWDSLMIEIGTEFRPDPAHELWVTIHARERGRVVSVDVQPGLWGTLEWDDEGGHHLVDLPGTVTTGVDSVRIAIARWDLPKWVHEAAILYAGEARLVAREEANATTLDLIPGSVPFYDMSEIF